MKTRAQQRIEAQRVAAEHGFDVPAAKGRGQQVIPVEIILEIKRGIEAREKLISIARRTGVHWYTVRDIKQGKAYNWVGIDTPSTCVTCGGPLKNAKQRLYCSDACTMRTWHTNNKPRSNQLQKESRRRVLYGLEPADYTALLEKHAGRCAICKQKKKLNIDHDHKTGAVRGLLCHGCNTAIGYIERMTPAMGRYLAGKAGEEGASWI